MKLNSNIYIITIIMVFSLFLTCKYDTECSDVYYGAIYLITKPINPIPYKNDDKLIFIDSLGNELIFRMLPFGRLTGNWIDKDYQVQSGPCKGNSKINCSLNFKGANFLSDSLNYEIYCQYQVSFIEFEGIPKFFDSVWSMIHADTNDLYRWNISVSHRTNDRGNESFLPGLSVYYKFDETLLLNGKVFNHVYSRTHDDGSKLYYNDEFGVIGFKEESNKLWVLDRIE